MGLRVRTIPHEVGDTKLFAKLSEGDMVTVEAVCHSNCIKKLYIRYRSHKNWKSRNRNNLEMTQCKFTRKRHGSSPDIKTN